MWKIVLVGSGYCILIGGATWVSLDHGIGVAALLAILHSIIAVLKKNSEVTTVEEPVAERAPAKKAKTTKKKASAKAASKAKSASQATQSSDAKPKSTNTKKNSSPQEAFGGFDTNVFAQFQKNLQDNQQTDPSLASAEPAKTVPTDPPQSNTESPNPYAHIQQPKPFVSELKTSLEEEQIAETTEDMVTLHSKRKTRKTELASLSPSTAETNGTPATSPSPQTNLDEGTNATSNNLPSKNLLRELMESADVAEDDDLFADVQVTLPSEERQAKENTVVGGARDLFDEGLGDVLNRYHSNEEKSMEARALLKMAEGSYAAGHVSEAKASMDNYFSLLHELSETATWEVQQLYGKICLRLGDVTRAVSSFSEVSQGMNPHHPEHGKVLEEITQALESLQHYEEVVPFLYDQLNHARQQLDRPKMDQVYERIERILESLGDDERLIRAYKNHLEIKRVLKDRDGESHLLDLLGSRYYKMGEKELSRKYYEDNLRLRASLEKVGSP